MWQALESQTSSMSKNRQIALPKLRAGTLDALMTLSDDLAKHDQHIESVLRKLERQMADLNVSEFSVEVDHKSIPPDEFVMDFKWASNKYQEKLTLNEINAKIFQEVSKVDEDLRTKQSEFNNVKSNLQTLVRKQQGNLAVRSLASLNLDTSAFLDTENLFTVVVVVPKMDDSVWLKSYETLLEKENLGFRPVLRASTKKLYEDNENSLWTVSLFRRKLPDFKSTLRETHPRWTVRELSKDDTAAEQEKQSLEEAKQHEDKIRKSLMNWTRSMYGEVFRAVVHLKMIRLFAESCLRYGVPPDFQPVVMKPNTKYESRLREELQKQFRHLGGASLYGQQSGEDNMPAGLVAADFYPYVFFTLTVAQPVTK
eukprot:c15417_g1_i1.p1 GENE.c15417_g1_i1~~c15417_g1_i1.p1  ORF type:complete len:419 (+),score=100.50 c15417_g1_i1:152-1258(+)